jgi:sulfur-carrier protein adenylyltransferase/sulfurtransferase
MNRFQIAHGPIPVQLLDPTQAAGAIVTFEGRVRDLNEGQQVLALEYEAFDELALKEGERILAEALKRFPLHDIACAHRVGRLELGDVAIRVEATSSHRREAFEACEFVVDEIKRRVPIWKKEHYASGPSEWLNVQGKQVVTQATFYDRQVRLPGVGEEGQERLRNARVLVVGAGGLGCAALPYLAAAGVGQITIVDSDIVDVSNLHRQPLYRASDAGYPKARLAAERLRTLNPLIAVEAQATRVDTGNGDDLVSRHDLVLDCTDNFQTKFLLNDLCVRLGRPLVVASIHQFDGQLIVVHPDGPCLRCLWPSKPPEDCVGSCADVGVLGVVPGVLGTLQASEAIKLLLGLPTRRGALALVDLVSLDLQTINLRRDPHCPACGEGEIDDEEPFVVTRLSPRDLVVDIREDAEIAADPLDGVVRMPMSRFSPQDLPPGEFDRVVLVCAKGVRSRHLAGYLQGLGYDRVYSWVGGRRDFGSSISHS